MPVVYRIPWIRLYFVAAALLFTGLMAVGIWRHHSAVPHWDMWEAYLGFYTRSGDWHAWWEQHNEHRLIVPRLIFWSDLHFFHGSMTLLFVLNTVFPFLIVACWVFLLHRLQSQRLPPGSACTVLVALLVVLATSWVQSENFTWAFQSQFFLAYLTPLLAFTLLAHARAANCRRSFWLAWLTGLLSAGTMANGTLALPLLLVQALLLRLRRRDVGVLLLTAALVLGLYFHHYHSYHPIVGSSIIGRWLDLARYVLLFLGGPWYFMLQQAAFWPAMVMGAAWIALALVMTVGVLRQRSPQPYAVALLMLLAYIGAAALGAARDRIFMGVEQALSSRYLTSQLMAWAALLLLAVYLWPRAVLSRWALGAYAAIPLLLLPAQLQGVRVPPDYRIQLRLPTLAIQLGVRDLDTDLFKRMTYTGENTFILAAQAKREHLAVFGEPDMQLALRHWSGQTVAAPMPQARCEGALQAIESIPGVADAVRVRGWLFDPARRQAPSLVLLSGAQQGRGAALGRLRQPDTVQSIDRPRRYSGFSGYLQASALAENPAGPVTLTGWIDQQPACALTLNPRP
ncbi:MAG: hypothetical protein LBH31_10160 [Burkholderiaceae bacterium]|jgi:hypothetical protein|nr:hypothetical protein [Burkholderiaceae bacterium]